MTKAEYRNRWLKVKQGIAIDTVNELKRVCPVDTGHLRNSISADVDNKGITIHMSKYAMFVEFGTPPHTIAPKNGKALHWKNANGTDAFAKVVFHPGTQPQPFIRSVFRTRFHSIVNENIKRYLLA